MLNDIAHQVNHIDPQTTLLDYLRDQLGKTGTKEGCASGDCGACTVVIARPVDDDDDDKNPLHYRSVNACITPLGSIHGQQLITVEDLADGAQLHPAQRAMVDEHGSQCGFCTPGFVMSLFAHGKNHSQPDRHEILESLGGNLCRCTGYRPIVDAAVAMYDPDTADTANHGVAGLTDKFSNQAATTAGTLRALKNQPASLAMGDRQFFAPTSLDELAALKAAKPDARLVAGGTDLSLEHTQMLKPIETLIHTSRVPELRQLEELPNGLSIGAAVTYSTAMPALVSHWPALTEMLERLGSKQVRNEGTIGGNIGNASPIGDMPPVLLALDATLVLRREQETRQLAVADFFLDYRKTALQEGEFIERVHIPYSSDDTLFRVYKISKRLEDDISAVCGAFAITLKGDHIVEARIGFGGMAAVPKRAAHAEAALRGRTFDESAIEAVISALSEDFAPISDFRASSDYRLITAGNLFKRMYYSRSLPASALQVTEHA